MTKSFQIHLEELEEWLNQETFSTTQPIKDEATRLINNLKSRLDEIRDISGKMLENSEKEMLKSNPKTYRRAKAISKLTQKTLEILDNSDIPDEISHENLRILHENTEKAISAIGQERGKWFPYVGPYFIFDRRRFDLALKRTVDSLDEVHGFSLNKYTKIKNVEESLSTAGKIVILLDELGELEKRKKQIESRSRVLEKEIDEKQKKISLFQSKNEVSELSQVNEEIKELKKQVKHNLRHLQKPFLKFQNIIRSSKYSLVPNEVNKLDEYLKNPFMAFATEEEKIPLLRGILQRMKDAINQRKLKLKSSRLRKAQEQMENILQKDALDSLHQNCRAALSQRQQLSTSQTISTFKKETEEIQRDLKKLKKRKNLVDSRWALLNAEERKNHKKIETLKQELEETVLELTAKAINIALE